MFYVAGFIWAEIKQLYQEGLHQYMVKKILSELQSLVQTSELLGRYLESLGLDDKLSLLSYDSSSGHGLCESKTLLNLSKTCMMVLSSVRLIKKSKIWRKEIHLVPRLFPPHLFTRLFLLLIFPRRRYMPSQDIMSDVAIGMPGIRRWSPKASSQQPISSVH